MARRDFRIKHRSIQTRVVRAFRSSFVHSAKKMKESLGNVKSTIRTTSGRLCITVLGSSAVGKTALTVQYLTSRFIGDYYSGTDMTYHHSFPYMGGSLKTNVDILDISRPHDNDVQEEDDMLLSLDTEKCNAFIVVYSLTNSKSFDRARQILSRLPFNSPKYLVANQLDLQHRRQVTRVEGQAVADEFGCPFDEFSAAESLYKDYPTQNQCGVKIVFQKLIRQLISSSHMLPYPRMIRFSAFSKILGALVTKTRHAANNNNNKAQKSLSNTRKSSLSSCSDRSSNSSGNTSIGSVDSIAVLTPEMSLLHIDTNSSHLLYGVKSKPISIARQKNPINYPSSQNASI
ncbi:ras-related and estrogen-regulated growth inhibitor-like protein [Daphnia carinata]|uniref:ras-related and estrogen-regulated growth inhibitor-like protein n=1 Tax=Daphnia carinata TaxID=120202 RepID=UPI002868E218|nr:ras-related and estrogen-regulated growth inhibitor-like protein [Daphnia carinata]